MPPSPSVPVSTLKKLPPGKPFGTFPVIEYTITHPDNSKETTQVIKWVWMEYDPPAYVPATRVALFRLDNGDYLGEFI